MEQEMSDLTGVFMLDNIFNLVITATKQIAEDPEMDLQSAKEAVANYLEKIVNGLRDEETDR
jgi:hypothetical protein